MKSGCFLPSPGSTMSFIRGVYVALCPLPSLLGFVPPCDPSLVHGFACPSPRHVLLRCSFMRAPIIPSSLPVADLFGRKVIAPKAKTQAEMNVFFQGAPWNLAERYTDMVREREEGREKAGRRGRGGSEGRHSCTDGDRKHRGVAGVGWDGS